MTSHAVPESPAIELRGVCRDFRRARTSLRGPAPVVHAVRDVTLTVARGERFGIVGESGSGKSTLLRLVCGLDRPTSGEILVGGRPVHDQPARRLGWLREQLQLVFQDPMGSLDPRMRVRDIIAEPLVAQGKRNNLDRVVELLERVGLSGDDADRYPHQFSGGQRQRISVARALAPDPAILVADEPVSALDVSVRAQVLNLIDEVVDGFDLTLVLVSHDLSVVRHVCDRIAVMRQGEVVELAPTEELFAAPRHPYTQALLAAVPDLHAALGGRTAEDLAAGVTRQGASRQGASRQDARQDVTTTELVGGVEQRPIVVVDPDPRWPQTYRTHEARIRAALGGVATAVEHIGSTSVPGLAAKPIIDILVTVDDITDEEAYLPPLLDAGYLLRVREPGHRLVRTPELDVHVHVLATGSSQAHDYLLLRDHLRRDGADRELYAQTKRELAAQERADMNAYSDAKTDVIAAINQRARGAR